MVVDDALLRLRATHVALDRVVVLAREALDGSTALDMALSALALNRAAYGHEVELPITVSLWYEIQDSLQQQNTILGGNDGP